MKGIILFILFNCIFLPSIFSQKDKIDSLETIIKSAREDANRVNAFNALTNIYLHVPPLHYRKAFLIAQEAASLSEKLSYKSGLMIASENLGNIYCYFGVYDKSLEWFLRMNNISEEIKDTNWIFRSYSDLSFAYSSQGNYQMALGVDFKLSYLAKILHDSDRIVQTFWGLASAYSDLCKESIKKGDSSRANSNYNKAIESDSIALCVSRKMGNKQNIGFFYLVMGHEYDKCNECEDGKLLNETHYIKADYLNKVEPCYQNALYIYQQLNYKDGFSDCYSNLGLYYRNQGELASEMNKLNEASKYYKQALNYFLKTLESLKELGYKHGIANYSKEVGITYSRLNNLTEAQKFISIGAKEFRQIGFKEGVKECYQQLAEVDAKKSDYKSAYKDFREYSLIKDSLLDEAKEKQINALNIKFETQQKTDSIAAEQKLITLKNKSIKKQNHYMIGLAVMILVISGLFVFTFLQTKKIGRQYNRIQVLQTELKHRTGNFFNSIKSMLSAAQYTSSDKETISSIENRVGTINHLYKTLYSSPKEEQITFSELLNSICNDLEYSFDQQNRIKVYPESDASVSKEEAIPLAFIITELVTNSYKHAFNSNTNGEIHVNVKKNNKMRILHVWDNGTGLCENEPAESGRQGMSIIKSYCKALNGKWNYWTDNGFHFKMEF